MIITLQDKALLHQCILLALESSYKTALEAAQQAYETATDNETKAENKYDTFSLEASYLAHGQSKRVEESLTQINTFKQLNVCLINDSVREGNLVLINNEHEKPLYYFISPVAGGLKVNFKDQEITLITPHAPLGKALMHGVIDDEITLSSKKTQCLNILAIY